MYIVWDWLTSEKYAVNDKSKIASVYSNQSVKSFRMTNDQEYYYNYWFHNVIKGHYWTASFIVPAGSLFVLALLILLMVLFKRCPLLVTAIVAAILAIIVVFAILVTVGNSPVYE